MSETRSHSETRTSAETLGAAGRAAALLVSVVLFAAIWESDSPEEQIAQIPEPGRIQLPQPQLPESLPESSDVGPSLTTIEHVLLHRNPAVRVRLEVESLAGSSRASLDNDVLLQGNVDEVRSRLVDLLEQLDRKNEVVPASAEMPEDFGVDPLFAESAENLPPTISPASSESITPNGDADAAPKPRQSKGLLFLGRRPVRTKSGIGL